MKKVTRTVTVYTNSVAYANRSGVTEVEVESYDEPLTVNTAPEKEGYTTIETQEIGREVFRVSMSIEDFVSEGVLEKVGD